MENARSNVYVVANDIMTYSYWNVVKQIVKRELKGSVKAKYGHTLSKNQHRIIGSVWHRDFHRKYIKLHAALCYISTGCFGREKNWRFY